MAEDELNYATYLHLDQLLSLQQPRSEPEEHDELLFITIHQASELWFKLLLHELDKIKIDLSANHLFRVISSFRRCVGIVKVLIDQFTVLETMTPLSFLRFRDRLDSSSGFQSMQFRELEHTLGRKRPDIYRHYPEDLPGREAAEARLTERSLPDHFYDFLELRGVEIPPVVRDRDPADGAIANDTVQAGIADLYRSDGQYVILFELMIDLDEALQEWRYRHYKIVERTIGDKGGTGGSLGTEFLRPTIFEQAFPDLWAIRRRF
ncbi:MAG: tryptophan 2,3-dioxygenase family protein [Actinomycetota bacterium]